MQTVTVQAFILLIWKGYSAAVGSSMVGTEVQLLAYVRHWTTCPKYNLSDMTSKMSKYQPHFKKKFIRMQQ